MTIKPEYGTIIGAKLTRDLYHVQTPLRSLLGDLDLPQSGDPIVVLNTQEQLFYANVLQVSTELVVFVLTSIKDCQCLHFSLAICCNKPGIAIEMQELLCSPC